MIQSKTTQAVTLGDDDLKEAVTEWLSRRFSGGGWQVTLGSEARYHGYGAGESVDYVAHVTATREVTHG